MYQIVEMTAHGQFVPFVDSATKAALTIAEGAMAKKLAAELSKTLNRKLIPRKVPDLNWRSREQDRFDRGEYQKPFFTSAWWGMYIPRDHYLHISKKDESKIAFTESAEKGEQDIQTQMKVGTYLQRYLSDYVSAVEISRIANLFVADQLGLELKLARTPDEIEHVYVHGPHSCMAGPVEDLGEYGGDGDAEEHPVRAYGAGDLACAYVEREGEIIARSICWPERKVFTSVYGEEHMLLRSMLTRAGYRAADSGKEFDGARFLELEVMPYIDFAISMEPLYEDGSYGWASAKSTKRRARMGSYKVYVGRYY
ncbi:hypothetical protein [Bradyrhizobium sp. Leo121]|uniref:hypothetical protein n=1 Tax=Bradyrhizobium sp. Leo121 TaxID=1571195 RepID=UPI00102997C5|nr:hypothetical protein [Bradyrhizobium sp. Leo121]RZN30500.1 hypothetical protein CWO90_20400 [Bradyrhizobium sp. Leo121]